MQDTGYIRVQGTERKAQQYTSYNMQHIGRSTHDAGCMNDTGLHDAPVDIAVVGHQSPFVLLKYLPCNKRYSYPDFCESMMRAYFLCGSGRRAWIGWIVTPPWFVFF